MNGPPQAQLESSTREVLAGLVERVTFHNAENGFCILRIKARGHRELITVDGGQRSHPPKAEITLRDCLLIEEVKFAADSLRCPS